MRKIAAMSISAVAALFFFAAPVLAHVVVKPSQVGIAAFQTFTVGVPNEKDNPTIALRLLIPEGLKFVSPNVKPGWKIEVKKQGTGDDAKVTEIDWTGGSIPVGQREDFFFSAQVPVNETTLSWKTYQTYQSGDVVSWDQDPNSMKNMSDDDKEKMEKQGKGPFSVTKVVNDLNASSSLTGTQNSMTQDTSNKMPLVLSVIAIVVSLTSLGMVLVKKK